MPHQDYLPFIQRVLTPNRLAHSLGVMQVMGELADVYGLDKDTALTTGLLHDAGKDLSPAEQERLIEEGQIEIHFDCERDYVFYLHGPVGAYYVHKELGITDLLILDAITTHTYYGDGEYFHHPLSWCLRFADLLEPGRDFRKYAWFHEGIQDLRSIVYAGRLDEAALLHLTLLAKWYPEIGSPVHPNISRIIQELSARL